MVLNMKIKKIKVGDIVDSVSKTHSFDCDYLFAVNTSDVLEGKLLNPQRLPVEELKGQFKKSIENGDILFSEIRPANKRYAFVNVDNPKEYVVSTKLMVLRKFNDEVDLTYFYYWLTNESLLNILQSRAENRIGSFPQITFDLLSSYEVPVPDISFQKKVASHLKTIDDKIDNNNAIIKTTIDAVNTLFDYWFFQYEFPNLDGLPYKSSSGEMIRDEILKKDVPVGWKHLKLKDLVSSEKYSIVDGPFGTQLKVEEYCESGIPVYEMELLNGLFIVDDINHFVSEEKYESIKRSTVKNGDIIISKTGTLGLLGIINSEYEKGIIVSRLAKITPDDSKMGKYTLLTFLQKLTDHNYWLNKSGGSTMPIINNSILENVDVLFPDNNLFITFEEKIRPMYEKIFYLQKQNKQLAKIKKDELSMFLSGQALIK